MTPTFRFLCALALIAIPVMGLKCYDCGFPSDPCTNPFDESLHNLMECNNDQTQCVTKLIENQVSRFCYSSDIICTTYPKNCTFCSEDACNSANLSYTNINIFLSLITTSILLIINI